MKSPLKFLIFLSIISFFALYLSAQSAIRILETQPRLYPNARTGGNYMHNYYLPQPGTSSPWWVSWSPDGKEVAFSMQGSIWRMVVGDSVANELVHSASYLSSPEWSPDGRYVAFTSDSAMRHINLHLLDLEKGEVTKLTSDEHLNLDPAWSPDGKQLAFVSTRPNSYFNIFIMTLENGQLGETIQVTHNTGLTNFDIPKNPKFMQPEWTEDGKYLLFLSNRGIPKGTGAIWKMPAEANGIEKAQLVHREGTQYRTHPDVSPDGTRIVYSSHLGGQFNNLFILPVEGGEPYKMTFAEWDCFHPRWSPDGERIAYLSNEEGLPQIHLLDAFGGKDEKLEVKGLQWKIPIGKVKVRIVDESTGEPIPARIYSTASDGKTYPPKGAFHRIARRLSEHYFHTSGEFELEVPIGELALEAMCGFEYYPKGTKITVEENQTKTITISLRRMTNFKEKKWYSGSNHVHMNYCGNLHNTPENLIFMAEAEDLGVIVEQVANNNNRILDHQYFTGDVHPLSDDQQVLYFNQEYRPPFYGHMSIINLKEHLISPFVTGYEGTAIQSLYPSNTDILRKAKQQGALGAYVHPFRGNADPLESRLGGAKAFPVDLALGTIDYHELASQANWATFIVWHHALNCGFEIPVVGGEDAITDLHKTAIIGQYRTYVFMDNGLSWDNWINGILKGNTIVTNGPLLQFSVDGKIPGEKTFLPKGGGKVKLKGSVQSIVPLEKAELVINGKTTLLADLSQHPDPKGEGTFYKFEKEIEINGSSWITLQAYADYPVHPIDAAFPQATTNPIWVTCGDQPVRSGESAEYFIKWIDKLSDMAAAHPGWRTEREKAHVLGQFEDAKGVYEKLRKEADQTATFKTKKE